MPKYLQAREILVDAIRSGRLQPGNKLPSTKEISSLVDISLITAHKALEGLVEAGWLRREVGRGTYVRDDVDPTRRDQGRLAVGLLLDHQDHVNIDDYYHSSIINGLRREARTDARKVEFFFHDGFDLHDRNSKDVGAICIHPPTESQPMVERLAQLHPVVILGGAFPGSDLAAVDCDNASGARDAVQHLLALGHRRFMVLSGPMNLSNTRDRANGALTELAAHGITPEKRDLPVSQDSVVLDEETKVLIERRLTDPDRPTAILAGGFYLALAIMQAAQNAGLQIPHDLSIVGFDDPASAALLGPPLTTVRQPLGSMASKAYELIRQAVIDNATPSALCKLPTELIIRQSTGPVTS